MDKHTGSQLEPKLVNAAYKPNVRRFMDRSGKVFTLGSRDPLPQPDETFPSKPTVEELENEVASIQDEEVPDELDTHRTLSTLMMMSQTQPT